MAISQSASKSPGHEENMEKQAQLKMGLRFGIGSLPGSSRDRVLVKVSEIGECCV
jgi:hypothetical protein